MEPLLTAPDTTHQQAPTRAPDGSPPVYLDPKTLYVESSPPPEHLDRSFRPEYRNELPELGLDSEDYLAAT